MWLRNVLYLVAGLAAVLLVVAIVLYNRLVRWRQNVRESWSAIDTELQRRRDLIPSLVEVVRGYAKHEKDTLEAVVQARSLAAESEGDINRQAGEETKLTERLRQLLAVVERYPDLKASDRFLDLQQQLVDTEDRISKARRFYNANVREMNTRVSSFPGNLIAGPFGFSEQPYFEADISAHTTPSVSM